MKSNININALNENQVITIKNELIQAIKTGIRPAGELFDAIFGSVSRQSFVCGRRDYTGKRIDQIVNVYFDFFEKGYFPFVTGDRRVEKFAAMITTL